MVFGLTMMVLVDVVMYVVILGNLGKIVFVVIINLNINFYCKLLLGRFWVEV